MSAKNAMTLTSAVPDPYNWRLDAACAGHDPELWFEHKEGSAALAKAICSTCPVARECLSDAMSQPNMAQVYGIWGGTGYEYRRELKRNGGRIREAS